MLFLDIMSWVLFIALIYCVFYIFIIVKNSYKGRLIDIKNRKYTSTPEQEMNVVIYSHNDENTIVELVESVKKQKYDPAKYTINVILDNCTDKSAKLLEIIGGARLWRITTEDGAIGKHKSYSWLLERLMANNNTNSFVFLDSDCSIKEDFLIKVNDALFDNPIIMGHTQKTKGTRGFWNCLSSIKDRLDLQVIKHGRFHSNLFNFLNTNVWAIRQTLLEKIEYPITDVLYENYEFSIDLAKENINIAVCQDVCVYKRYDENLNSFALKKFTRRIEHFKTCLYNFKTFSNGNLKIKELLTSLKIPSFFSVLLTTMILYIASAKTNLNFANFIKPEYVLGVFGSYLLANTYMLTKIRYTITDLSYILAYIAILPVISFMSYLPIFSINLKPEKTEAFKELHGKNYDKRIIQARITDGIKELNCEIEIRQNETSAQLIFTHANKKLSTTKHTRVDDALMELIEKLKFHGFALKVCMNCGYFKYDYAIGAKYSGEQGYCLADNLHKGSKSNTCSYIWNSCSNIIPSQASTYVQQQILKAKPTETPE